VISLSRRDLSSPFDTTSLKCIGRSCERDEIEMNLLGRKVSIDRYLFRLIIIGLLIAFIVSQVFWAGRLFARIWNFPELRHRIVVQPSSTDNPSLAQLSVVNLGFGSAENVLIHVRSGSRIYWHQIDAQELYEIKTLDLKRGVMNIWLDRLASGAWVEITIAGENLSQERVQLSVASDQGTSVSIEQQTFSDQVEEYAGSVTDLFREAWHIAVTTERAQEVSEWISTKPSLVGHWEVFTSYEFKTVALAMLILVLLVGLFFHYEHFILAVFASTWVLTWLFIDLEIPLSLIIGLGGLVALRIFSFISEGTYDEQVSFFLVVAFLALMAGVGFFIWWFWYIWVSADWLLGILAAGAVTLIIILLRILPPLPKERQDSGTEQ